MSRAFLSRFERVRNEVRGLYDALDLEGALDRLAQFMEQDVATGYLPLARPRLDPHASPSVRIATCQALARVLLLWIELFAPVAPFTSEAIAQAFRPDSASLFERPLTSIADALVDSEREKEFDRWVDFAEALRSARRQVGLAADAILPRVVLLVADDTLGSELQRVSPVLARVGRTGQIEIDSPSRAWAGRRIEARPVAAEIQRVYGSRSGRILHLLERFPGRRAMEGMHNGNLQVVLDGQTVKILPGMIEFMESLPECVIPVPWRDGEILLIDPTENSAGSLPSLSLDGLAIVRHVGRRIRKAGTRPPPERILAAATGALAGELEHHAAAIASHLGAGRFQLVGDDIRFPLNERSTGRTRRGDRWAIWIPGFPVGGTRTKHPRARPRGSRVQAPRPGRARTEATNSTRRGWHATMLISSFPTSFPRTWAARSWDQPRWRPRGPPASEASTTFGTHRSRGSLRCPGFGHFVAAEIVGEYGGPMPAHAPRLAPIRPRSPRVLLPVSPPPPAAAVPNASDPVRAPSTDGRPSLPQIPPAAPAADTPRPASLGAAPSAPRVGPDPAAEAPGHSPVRARSHHRCSPPSGRPPFRPPILRSRHRFSLSRPRPARSRRFRSCRPR